MPCFSNQREFPHDMFHLHTIFHDSDRLLIVFKTRSEDVLKVEYNKPNAVAR